LQLRKLRKQLAYLAEHSVFYREKLSQAKMAPEELQCLDDLQAIPRTDKGEFRQHQRDIVCASPKEVVDIGATTGTTGEPLLLPASRADWDELVEILTRGMHGLGLTDGDVFQIAVAFDQLFSLGAPMDDALKNLGVTVVRTGPGNRRMQVEIMRRVGSTGILATPDYMQLLGQQAREMGYDPGQDFNLRLALLVGHGLYTAEWKPNSLNRRVAETWGIEVYSDYGSMEMLAGLIECEEHGGHHVPADQIIVEITDPETGRQLHSGEQGEVVVTHLSRTGTPLLRFRQGDVASMQTTPCTCGRTTPRVMAVLGRLDHALKVKGVTLYPDQIQEALMSIPAVEAYVVEAHEDVGGDRFHVHIACTQEVESVLKQVRTKLKASLRVSPQVLEVATQEEITERWFARGTRKPQKFWDHRQG
jgi:phenylacetate-CoA ligase